MSIYEHGTIYSNLNLLQTDDLIGIYLNKEDEFTELGFKVVQEILLERLGSLPAHKSAEISEDDKEEDEESVAEGEDELESEFAPEFYRPKNAIRLEKWLYAAGRVVLVVLVFFMLSNYVNLNNALRIYFPVAMRNSFIVIALTVLGLIVDYVTNVAVLVLPLIGIAKLLRILMQMEVDSRGGATSSKIKAAEKPFVKGDGWLSKLLNWEQW